jgi:hypothetical protein
MKYGARINDIYDVGVAIIYVTEMLLKKLKL